MTHTYTQLHTHPPLLYCHNTFAHKTIPQLPTVCCSTDPPTERPADWPSSVACCGAHTLFQYIALGQADMRAFECTGAVFVRQEYWSNVGRSIRFCECFIRKTDEWFWICSKYKNINKMFSQLYGRKANKVCSTKILMYGSSFGTTYRLLHLRINVFVIMLKFLIITTNYQLKLSTGIGRSLLF